MKTKKNNTMAMQLPGALALAAAGAATQANAATVQITFNGSYISSTGGNHLVTDFGGDGDDELAVKRFSNGGIIMGVNPYDFSGGFPRLASVGYGAPGKIAAVVWAGFPPLGGVGERVVQAIAGRPVTFSDASIRGGASTIGYLDITATSTSSESMITFNRLIFDDATGGAITGLNVNTTYATYGAAAVPEPSSLGLLALGAGGLLARRRRAMAA